MFLNNANLGVAGGIVPTDEQLIAWVKGYFTAGWSWDQIREHFQNHDKLDVSGSQWGAIRWKEVLGFDPNKRNVSNYSGPITGGTGPLNYVGVLELVKRDYPRKTLLQIGRSLIEVDVLTQAEWDAVDWETSLAIGRVVMWGEFDPAPGTVTVVDPVPVAQQYSNDQVIAAVLASMAQGFTFEQARYGAQSKYGITDAQWNSINWNAVLPQQNYVTNAPVPAPSPAVSPVQTVTTVTTPAPAPSSPVPTSSGPASNVSPSGNVAYSVPVVATQNPDGSYSYETMTNVSATGPTVNNPTGAPMQLSAPGGGAGGLIAAVLAALLLGS